MVSTKFLEVGPDGYDYYMVGRMKYRACIGCSGIPQVGGTTYECKSDCPIANSVYSIKAISPDVWDEIPKPGENKIEVIIESEKFNRDRDRSRSPIIRNTQSFKDSAFHFDNPNIDLGYSGDRNAQKTSNRRRSKRIRATETASFKPLDLDYASFEDFYDSTVDKNTHISMEDYILRMDAKKAEWRKMIEEASKRQNENWKKEKSVEEELDKKSSSNEYLKSELEKLRCKNNETEKDIMGLITNFKKEVSIINDRFK